MEHDDGRAADEAFPLPPPTQAASEDDIAAGPPDDDTLVDAAGTYIWDRHE